MKALGVTSLLLLAGVLSIAGFIVVLDANPLRRSDDEIRKWVLDKTPLGSSRSEVTVAIAREPWLPHSDYRGSGKPPVEGVSHFAAELGSYQGFPFRCQKHAYWAFDAEDKLVDVHVNGWCEGL